MATLTLHGLQILLEDLGLKVPLPQFSAAEVLAKPMDIGRAYLADILCSLVESNSDHAYGSIQWPGDIYNGDLAVVLPKLRHRADSEALAFDLMKRVCLSHLCVVIWLLDPAKHLTGLF